MPHAQIFLVHESAARLTRLAETAYASEDVLQTYLASFPELLPGDQINPDQPRRWLLVRREMAVPDAPNGQGRWSVDHLFLDQDGTPTFVECKRATDTRSRREVVAQMLDYAANGTIYWSADRLRAAAEQTHGGTEALRAAVCDLLELDLQSEESGDASDLDAMAGTEHSGGSQSSEVDLFWRRVADNLDAGRVRLIFVADELPRELRRLIEFLNAKMADVEIIGVELRQFAAGEAGRRVLVPRVIGITEEARDRKPSSATASPRRAAIDWSAFVAECSPTVLAFFERIMTDAQATGYTIGWSSTCFTIRSPHPATGRLRTIAYGYPNHHGSPPPCLVIYLQFLDLSGKDLSDVIALTCQDGSFVSAPTGSWSLRGMLYDANVAQIERAWQRFRSRVEEIDARTDSV